MTFKGSDFRGMKLVNIDAFGGGVDQDLTSAGWTKIGASAIREDGNGTAYSTAKLSLGLGLYGKGNFRNNRKITVTCQAVLSNCSCGILLSGTGSKSYSALVCTNATSVDNFLYSYDYGTSAATNLGSLTIGGSLRLMRAIIRGNTLFYDIDNGALSGSIGLAGSFQKNEKSGLFYQGKALMLGYGAFWQNFEAREFSTGGGI